jgi:predicted DNA-binding protein
VSRSSKPSLARIAITLPPETLRAADELAARQNRSRSWIVAEAIRQYAAAQRVAASTEDAVTRLGRSRMEQLRRDLSLSAEARVLESEEIAVVGRPLAEPESPRTFATYDDYLAWRREREGR